MTALQQQGAAAKAAARVLATAGTLKKTAALAAIADTLTARQSEWLAANAEDVAAALREDTVDLRAADLTCAAVVIGSEGRGVRQEILDRADAQLIIPMNAHCESLNAAIAAAIAEDMGTDVSAIRIVSIKKV